MVNIYGKIQKDLSRETKKWQHTSPQQEVILSKMTQAASDPSTPYLPGARTYVSYKLEALIAGVDEEMVDGKTILSTDLTVTFAPYGLVNGVLTAIGEPTVKDKLTIAGVTREIKKTLVTPPIGTPVNITLFIAG
jgi:hypothetical protein